jgi:hypothetical protein
MVEGGASAGQAIGLADLLVQDPGETDAAQRADAAGPVRRRRSAA